MSRQRALPPDDVRVPHDVQQRNRILRWARDGQSQDWWQDYVDVFQLDVVPDHFSTYLALEVDATTQCVFQVALVPGLLQTARYARAVIGALAFEYSANKVERLVDLRLQRQQVLSRRTPPLQLCCVIDESILYRPVGGCDVMAEQLRALVSASQRPNVRIQVMPFDVGVHPAIVGSFEMLQFSDAEDQDVLLVEWTTGDIYLEHDAEIMRYRRVFNEACDLALDPIESVARIAAAADSLESLE